MAKGDVRTRLDLQSRRSRARGPLALHARSAGRRPGLRTSLPALSLQTNPYCREREVRWLVQRTSSLRQHRRAAASAVYTAYFDLCNAYMTVYATQPANARRKRWMNFPRRRKDDDLQGYAAPTD